MAQPTRASTKTKAEQEAQQKALRRAEQANILAGIRPILEPEEQLLAFARARIAGGWRGKLNVGPEAFFAPFANVALTERRFVVQHVHHTSGRPSEMLPHSYTLGAIASATFTDIETFGGEPACRLILHLQNGLYVRLRLRGQLNFAAAKNMVELYDSLTLAQRSVPVSPLQKNCANCHQILDQDYKFCPYCGTAQASASGITLATREEGETGRQGEEENAAVAEPVYVAQETDFAYERADQPAEFGTALPLPDAAQPEPEEIVDTTPEENAAPPETGLTTAETSSEDSGQGKENGPRLTLEPDDLTTMDYPLSAEFDTTEPIPTTATTSESASADFGQYDAQDFAELPFTQSSNAQSDDAHGQALNVADDQSDIVRDDINEAFASSYANDSAGIVKGIQRGTSQLVCFGYGACHRRRQH